MDEKLEIQLQKLEISMGDVLIVRADEKYGIAAAQSLQESEIFPPGIPIIVMDPDIHVDSLRNASQEVKDQILNAMETQVQTVQTDWSSN